MQPILIPMSQKMQRLHKTRQFIVNESGLLFLIGCINKFGRTKGEQKFKEHYYHYLRKIIKYEVAFFTQRIRFLSTHNQKIISAKTKVFEVVADFFPDDIAGLITTMYVESEIFYPSQNVILYQSSLKVFNKMKYCNRSKRLMKKFTQCYKKHKELKEIICDKQYRENNLLFSLNIEHLCREYNKIYFLGIDHVF